MILCPPKKASTILSWKAFSNFQLWKGIRIHLGIHRIYLTLFFLGFPGPTWDPCLRRFRGVPGRSGCHWLGYLSLGEIWTSALRAGWDAFFRIFWGCHRNVDVKKNWINRIKDSCKAICAETYINKLFKIVCGIFDPAWSSCAACELLRRNKVWVCEWLSFLWFLALKDSEKGPTGNSKTPTRLPFVVCWPRISNMASRVKLRERLVVMLYSTARCFDSFRGYVRLIRILQSWRGFRARMPCHLFSLRCLILGSQFEPKQQFGGDISDWVIFNHSKCVRNTSRKRPFVHKHVRASCFSQRSTIWSEMIWVERSYFIDILEKMITHWLICLRWVDVLMFPVSEQENDIFHE